MLRWNMTMTEFRFNVRERHRATRRKGFKNLLIVLWAKLIYINM